MDVLRHLLPNLGHHAVVDAKLNVPESPCQQHRCLPGAADTLQPREVQEPSPSSWYPAPVSVNLGFCSPQWIHRLKRGHAKGCGRQQNLLPNVSRLPRPSGLPSMKRTSPSCGILWVGWSHFGHFSSFSSERAKCPPTFCSMPRGAPATDDKL